MSQISFIRNFSIACCFLLLSAFKTTKTPTGKLIITVENLPNTDGEIVLALFTNEDDFLKKDFMSKSFKVENGVYVIDSIPEGKYSISIFHDKNSNGKLDKNLLGIPTEGFGFSNDKFGKFGPPDFEECLIEIKGETKTTITLMDFL